MKVNHILCILCLHFISPLLYHNTENLTPRENIWSVYLLGIHRPSICILHTKLLIHPSKFTHMFVMGMHCVCHLNSETGLRFCYYQNTYKNMFRTNLGWVIKSKILITQNVLISKLTYISMLEEILTCADKNVKRWGLLFKKMFWILGEGKRALLLGTIISIQNHNDF